MFNKLNILCDLMFRKYASKNTASLIKACYGHIKICSKLKKNFRVCKLEGMHLSAAEGQCCNSIYITRDVIDTKQ